MLGAENIKFSANDMQDKSLFYNREKNGKRIVTKQGLAVLWYMQKIIGIDEITRKNWTEVFERIENFEDEFGAIVVFWEDNKPIHNPIEKDEVQSMIGLKLKEPNKILTKEQWESKLKAILEDRKSEEERISKQYENVPDEAPIEELAPGAEIHTQPIISMPNVGQK